MDLKNAVKALQIGKKEGEKYVRFRNTHARRCAGKTGQI